MKQSERLSARGWQEAANNMVRAEKAEARLAAVEEALRQIIRYGEREGKTFKVTGDIARAALEKTRSDCTEWEIVELPGWPQSVSVWLSVDSRSREVTESIEKACERHGIVLRRDRPSPIPAYPGDKV